MINSFENDLCIRGYVTQTLRLRVKSPGLMKQMGRGARKTRGVCRDAPNDRKEKKKRYQFDTILLNSASATWSIALVMAVCWAL